MKYKNKTRIIGVTIFIIIWFAVGAAFVHQNNQPDPYIGQTLVIKQDTLMVLAYNRYTGNYVLDDEREVSESIIKLFKIENGKY